jgi:hypothetical protein
LETDTKIFLWVRAQYFDTGGLSYGTQFVVRYDPTEDRGTVLVADYQGIVPDGWLSEDAPVLERSVLETLDSAR